MENELCRSVSLQDETVDGIFGRSTVKPTALQRSRIALSLDAVLQRSADLRATASSTC